MKITDPLGLPPLADDGAADYYAQIIELRRLADYHERRLIRFLRHDAPTGCRRDQPTGHQWAHVAELVDGNLHSKQAAHIRWSRLIATGRREPGEPGRGGRTPSKSNDGNT